MSAAPTARVITSLRGIDAEQWNACALGHPIGHPKKVNNAESPHERPDSPLEPADSHSEPPTINPFISHEFLSSLEVSGCVGRGTGWSAAHLLLTDDAGQLIGATPSYLKTNSQGEYVFDHSWADAYERAGGRYYPKLQVSAPFTPATGPRLLVRGGDGAEQRRRMLAGALDSLRQQAKASSTHITFVNDADAAILAGEGYLTRHDLQFHWQNEGFGTYEDFLGTLASRKRKALKKERREAIGEGITIHHLSGAELTESVWDAFHGFYEDTGARKWGRPYLNRRFFSLVGERMGHQVILVMARRAGRYIAGAINFLGHDTLFGRHWGCIEEHPFLHFELCYHQAIDIAIARGLKIVEAGAQGEHKLARGYRPVTTRSMHQLADPGLQKAVARFLEEERRGIAALREEMEAQSPFRKNMNGNAE